MTICRISVLVILSTLIPLIANARELVCDGKIVRLQYHSNIGLMIQLETMNQAVYFCSPDSNWSVPGTGYKTSPETCKTIYAAFLAAQMAGKTIRSMYFDGDDVPDSCDKWGPWKRANIRFFRLDSD